MGSYENSLESRTKHTGEAATEQLGRCLRTIARCRVEVESAAAVLWHSIETQKRLIEAQLAAFEEMIQSSIRRMRVCEASSRVLCELFYVIDVTSTLKAVKSLCLFNDFAVEHGEEESGITEKMLYTDEVLLPITTKEKHARKTCRQPVPVKEVLSDDSDTLFISD